MRFLLLSMTSPSPFQFSNIEVGDLNKVLDCDLRAPLPIEYHPLEDYVDLLEKPFRVIMNESHVSDKAVNVCSATSSYSIIIVSRSGNLCYDQRSLYKCTFRVPLPIRSQATWKGLRNPSGSPT